MNRNNVFSALFIILSFNSYGQEKEIRIGPGPHPKQRTGVPGLVSPNVSQNYSQNTYLRLNP